MILRVTDLMIRARDQRLGGVAQWIRSNRHVAIALINTETQREGSQGTSQGTEGSRADSVAQET